MKPQQFAEHIKQRARQLAGESDRPTDAKGVTLTPLDRAVDELLKEMEANKKEK